LQRACSVWRSSVYAGGRTWEEIMSIRKRTWRTPQTGELREAWIVDFVDQSGQRRNKNFERKRDAEAYEATVRVNIARGIHSHSRMTVAQAGQLWLDDVDGRLERSTVESYRQHLNDHIIPYVGMVKLADLTVPLVREFIDRLRAGKRSPAMIKRVIGDLGAILGDAQERGLIAQNAVHSLSRGKRQQAQRQSERRQRSMLKVGVDIPSPHEIRAILSKLDGRWRPLLLTAIFTWLRASELRGLRWSDVDLKKAELHVRQRADRFNAMGQPKSHAGQRVVPLPPIVVSTLREWKLACPKGELDLVFPNGHGRIESHANIVNRGLWPVQIAAGVVTKKGDAKYSLHALRHFYASWCINRRADGGLELPLKVVQHRLGHSSIQMTSDRYGHLFPSSDTGAELAAAQKSLIG
jgi:integrase